MVEYQDSSSRWSIEELAGELTQELPEVDAERLREALERAVTRLEASLPVIELAHLLTRLADSPYDEAVLAEFDQTERQLLAARQWEPLVDLHLGRVATATDAPSRAAYLAALSHVLEVEVGDPGRALSALFAAFREAPAAGLLPDLARLAEHTERWQELSRALSDGAGAAPREDRAPMLRLLAGVYSNHVDDLGAEIACLEQLREQAPGDLELLRTLASHYAATGRRRDRIGVLEELTDLVQDVSERATLYRHMADEWEHLGEPDRSAECYEWVLACWPNDLDAYRALQRIYSAGRRWRAAIDAHMRHAAIVPSDAQADLYVQVGRIYEDELGDCARALDSYVRADEADPQRPQVLTELARLYVEREHYEDAVTTLERCARLASTPNERALHLHNAANIAARELADSDLSGDLLEQAVHADPDRLASAEALAGFHNQRDEPEQAGAILEAAADKLTDSSEGPRLLVGAALAWASAEQDERAMKLCRAALDLDPDFEPALEALARLLWRRRELTALVPMLATLAARATETETRHARLWRLARAARELGDLDAARAALTAIVSEYGDDLAARIELGELLFAAEQWDAARQILGETLAHHESDLSREHVIETHYRVGRCHQARADTSSARVHIDTALALDPSHRPALIARSELDASEPNALITYKLALAASAPAAERAALLSEIGDIYARRLGDPISAREMYRDALSYRPTDHLLLNKCLALIVEQRDWAQGNEMLERLIETEKDPAVRAKYRHVAATILNQELHRSDDAIALLSAALDEDPTLSAAACDLETLLGEREDSAQMIEFYCTRLNQLRDVSGCEDECLRLWTELADLYLRLRRRDDARCALEVVTTLDPHDQTRRQRLATLYGELGPAYRSPAIEQHQRLLRANPRRVASYHALRGLYRLSGQADKERACGEALDIIEMRAVGEAESRRANHDAAIDLDGPALDGKLWGQLGGNDVNRMASVLFAITAPLFANNWARSRQQLGLRRKDRLGDADSRRFAPILRSVARRLGMALPAVYIRRDQPSACAIAMCAVSGGASLAITVGRPALEQALSDRALAFLFARTLCDLRADRAARFIFPNARALAQMVDAAVVVGARREATTAAPAAANATSDWLEHNLAPLELDQVTTIGVRLYQNNAEGLATAVEWLEATERAATRVAFALAGDLRACIQALVAERGPREGLVLDLVRASVSEAMFSAREQLEASPNRRASARIAEPSSTHKRSG